MCLPTLMRIWLMVGWFGKITPHFQIREDMSRITHLDIFMFQLQLLSKKVIGLHSALRVESESHSFHDN